MRSLIHGALLFAASALPVLAQDNGPNLSGNDLHETCHDTEMARQGFCLGYIVGVVEGMRWGTAVPLIQSDLEGDALEGNINLILNFCLPENATWGQYRDVIVQHVEQHPETRHASARLLAQIALSEAFPCPNP